MGRIIVIEGTDGSGKKTQSLLLEKKLKEQGDKVVTISFPTYETPTGKIVGGPYLGRSDICPSYFNEDLFDVDPAIACLYYAADRKYNLPKIKEYLNADYTVILDRYTSSNMAHQGSKIEDPDERFNMYQMIDKLEYWLLGLPKADITIFLHVPFDHSKVLRQERMIVDEVENHEVYMKRSEECYIELSELYNWNRIECNDENNNLRTIEDINQEIMEIIK